jgi:RNA polymerase sigma-70 factor (ECF subfamily)
MPPRPDLAAFTDGQLAGLAAATRDEAAFAELVRRRQQGLRRFLESICRDSALADDLAQETFVRAFAALHRLDDPEAFQAWLYRIGLRQCLMALRRAKTRRRLFAGFQPDPPPPSDADLSLDLREGLASLDLYERAAIVLCDIQGMAHAEAALALDAPLGTVKTWVRRGRARMRARLEAQG